MPPDHPAKNPPSHLKRKRTHEAASRQRESRKNRYKDQERAEAGENGWFCETCSEKAERYLKQNNWQDNEDIAYFREPVTWDKKKCFRCSSNRPEGLDNTAAIQMGLARTEAAAARADADERGEEVPSEVSKKRRKRGGQKFKKKKPRLGAARKRSRKCTRTEV